MRLRIIEILNSAIIMPMVILSCGALGALLLRFQFIFTDILFVIPLICATYVSCKKFYRFMLSTEEVACPNRLESE